MKVYKIAKDSPIQFFWNNGVDYPNYETFNKITWEEIPSHFNMGSSFENGEIVIEGTDNKPPLFFKVVTSSAVFYYKTNTWLITQKATVCKTELDYWCSYMLKEENWNTFIKNEFRFIRQPEYVLGVHENILDPLITTTSDYTQTEVVPFTHLMNEDNVFDYYRISGKFTSILNRFDINSKNFLYAVFFISETHPLRNITRIIDKNGKQIKDALTNQGYTLCIPILWDDDYPYQSRRIIALNEKLPNIESSDRSYYKIYNTTKGIFHFINEKKLNNVFKGYYYGPPFYATPANAVVEFEYALNPGGWMAASVWIGWVFNLSSRIAAPTPFENQKYLKYLTPRINNSPIPSSFFSSKEDKEWKCCFTNKFILTTKDDTTIIEYPHQVTSYSDSYLSFLAGNSNSLDTARNNSIGMGVTNMFMGITSSIVGGASANMNMVLGGAGQFVNAAGSMGSVLASQRAMIKDQSIARNVENRAAVDEGNIWYNRVAKPYVIAPATSPWLPEDQPSPEITGPVGAYYISLNVPENKKTELTYINLLTKIKKEKENVGWYGEILINPKTNGYHQLLDPFFRQKMKFKNMSNQQIKEIENILTEGIYLK